MPPLETMDRYQRAQYWPPVSKGRDGRWIVSDEAEGVDVRWVAKRKEVMNNQNEKIAIDVTVIADFEMEIGSIVWLGDSLDFGTGTGTTDYPTTDLMAIVHADVTTDLLNRYTRYENYAVRYNDLLPIRAR